jgi:hypothetical protein
VSKQQHKPDTLIREAASLLYLLGGMTPKHLVIVGGLVPPLLVPDAIEPHVGSADIDLSLSVAITAGATREYYKSIEKIIDPYFEPVESGFRWRKKAGVSGVPVLIDFLGPEVETTPLRDGTLELGDENAKANTGFRLRPFPLSAGRLVDEDALSTLLEGVELVYKQGTHADVEIRHAGPVGFLASKADALDSRDGPKDGYDVSWWCIHAKSTPEEVAQLVLERPAFRDPYFQESVAKLAKAFKAPTYVGPSGYAAERNPNSSPGDAAFDEDRNRAFVAVSAIIEVLRANLWSGPSSSEADRPNA